MADETTTIPKRQRAVITITELPDGGMDVDCIFDLPFLAHGPKRDVEAAALAAMELIYEPSEGHEVVSVQTNGKEVWRREDSALERYIRG